MASFEIIDEMTYRIDNRYGFKHAIRDSWEKICGKTDFRGAKAEKALPSKQDIKDAVKGYPKPRYFPVVLKLIPVQEGRLIFIVRRLYGRC